MNANANISMITRIINAYNELATFIIAIIICYMVADFMADVMFKKIEQLIIAKKNKDKIEDQRKIEEQNKMDQMIEELKQKDEDIAGLHMIIKLLNEQIVNMSNNNKPKDDICDRLWSDVLINDKK
jgi:hypothetical protein